MDARTLGLSEDLRIWHDLGLRHVLCTDDVAALRPRLGLAPGGPGRDAPRGGPPPRPRMAEARQPDAAPRRPGREAEPRAARAPGPASETPPGPPPAARPAAPGGPLAVFPWEQFRPRLITPSRTVWTYWELGLDFGPRPDPARRELFGNIMRALRWPKKSVTFWPLSFEHQGRLLANKGSFLRGVGETGAGLIVCFGQRAFEVLFPRQRYAPGTHRLEARTVLALPGPEEMLGGDAQAKRLVWDTLRALRL